MADENVILHLKAIDGVSGVLHGIGSEFAQLGQSVGGDLGELLDHVGQGFDEVGRAAGTLGGKLTAIGAAAVGLGGALIVLGSKEAQATDQLRVAIEDTGASFEDYEKQIEGAVRQGEAFAFSSEDTKNALAALTQSTQNPTLALKAMTAVMDFAAAKHESLAAAASQVQRALNGNGRVLRQYGIDLTKIKDPTEKADAAIAGLEARFGGQAGASVSNFGAQIDVVTNKLTDMLKAVSGPVGQGLTVIGTALSTVGVILQVVLSKKTLDATRANIALAESNVKVATTADAVAVSANAAAIALTRQEEASIAAGGAGNGLPGGIAGGRKGGTGLKVGAGLLAGFGVAQGFQAAGILDPSTVDDLRKNASDLDTQYTAAFSDIADNSDKVITTLDDVANSFLGISTPTDNAKQSIGAFDAQMADFVSNGDVQNARDMWNELVDVAKTHGVTVDQLAKQFPAFTTALQHANIQLSDMAPKTQTTVEKYQRLAEVEGKAEDAGDKLANRNAAIINQLPTLIDRNNQVAATYLAMGDRASGWVSQSQFAYDEAIKRTALLAETNYDLKIAADVASHALVMQQRDLGALDQATQDLYNAQIDVRLGLKQSAKDIGAYNKNTHIGAQKTHDLATSLEEVASKAADVDVATGKAKDHDSAYRTELDKLRDKVKAGSPLRKELDGLITALDNVAKQRTANILIQITEHSRGAFGHQPSTYYLTTPPKPKPKPSGGKTKISGGGGFANAGESIIVGDAGPELFTPSHPGVVLPNGAFGGGSVVHNTTYNVYPKSTDPTEVIRLIQKFERGNTPSWRAA